MKKPKLLSEIQRRANRRRRITRFVPHTCKACGHEAAYPVGTEVCEKCGTIGELVEWRMTRDG